MKRVVVVEDRPWMTTEATVGLQKKGVTFYKTIYYPSLLLNSKEKELLMQKYRDKTGLPVEVVNGQREFIDKMDELYSLDDVVFLMDYDLKGDMAVDDFFSRVNIKYALEKRKQQGEEKIWFYTTGGSDVRTALVSNFQDRVIRVPHFMNNQIQWDEDSVIRIAEG